MASPAKARIAVSSRMPGLAEQGRPCVQFRDITRRLATAIALVCLAACGSRLIAQEPDSPEPAAQQEPLPPAPGGKATVIGGTIGHLDTVRDRFALQVYGGKPLKVLYDARTELYRDGARAPLSSLRPDERASVETTLDGTDVFALRIHILSKAPEGDCEGQVTRVDAAAGLIDVRCGGAAQTVRFHIASNTPVSLQGKEQGGLAGIVPQTLVAVRFSPGKQVQAEAAHINVLAAPGQVFTFNGTITSLDLTAGRMVLQDDRDSYVIRFIPDRFPDSSAFREGTQATVVAGFDGSAYTAETIRLR